MEDFEFLNTTKLIFGKSAMSKLRAEVERYGNKVLVTYGKGSIIQNGIYQAVMAQLKGKDVREFSGIEPNPRVETVREAIARFREFNPDIVLSVGGGSVIDGSKLLVSSLHYPGDPWDFLTDEHVEPEKYVPLGTVLTVAATGSEMNNTAVITNWNESLKLHFSRTHASPRFSILDPRHTFSVSQIQTAYGIVDAFSHVLEQYITTTSDTQLQDRWSEGILLTLVTNSSLVLNNPTNYEARADIMLSATMALNGLIGMGITQDWATHMIEHELSAFYDIPHGAGLAIITPRWMKAVVHQKKEKLAQYGRRVWGITGNDEEAAKLAIRKTHEFFASMGVRMSLTEWDIDGVNFPVMVERLVKKGIGETPLSEEQIDEILQNSLEETV